MEHDLKKNLTISLDEYRERRLLLVESMSKNSIAIIFAAEPKVRNGGTDFSYRQNSNFYYLSGLTESKAALVLIKSDEGYSEIIFCKEKNAFDELWHGEVLGTELATKVLGIENAKAYDKLFDFLLDYLGKYDFYFAGSTKGINEVCSKLKINNPNKLCNLLGHLRSIKSPTEIEIMKRAAQISSNAHNEVLKSCLNAAYEYELEAIFNFNCCYNGARSNAYPPIVAGSKNACTLHYNSNNAELKKGDLLLIDAGCEYNLYASDITRVFPVGGKFSKAQRKIYDIVLNAQLEVIKLIKPGIYFKELQECAVKCLSKSLLDLGFLQGELDEVIKTQSYKKYFPHGVSHSIGLDVHDAQDLSVPRDQHILKENMLFTVEPGLYFPLNDSDIPKEYRGIGIRIEDDILVSHDGAVVLSSDAIKDPSEIEKAMQ